MLKLWPSKNAIKVIREYISLHCLFIVLHWRKKYLRSKVFSLLSDLRFSAVSAAAIVISFECSLSSSALKLLGNRYFWRNRHFHAPLSVLTHRIYPPKIGTFRQCSVFPAGSLLQKVYPCYWRSIKATSISRCRTRFWIDPENAF